MNAHNDSLPEPDDDPLLEEMLSHLKRLEPPLAARIANRQAVSAALSSFNAVSQQRHLVWWRRSVSIPMPLAAALVMLMAIALYSSFRNWQERSALLIATTAQPRDDAATAHGNTTALTQPVAKAYPTWQHYETETYLCGVGRVNSESYYAIKE
jgi:hypothetical protein